MPGINIPTPSRLCIYLPVEDIKLNTTVFHWPETISQVFELSQSRIGNRREQVEDELKKKVSNFEEKLNEYQKEIDSFRKKEVSLVTTRKPLNYGRNSWCGNSRQKILVLRDLIMLIIHVSKKTMNTDQNYKTYIEK